MSKEKKLSINWLSDVEDHDYPAAESYLNLIYPHERVSDMLSQFKNAPITKFKAKDIFRASQLSLLGISNLHVEKDREKIENGQALSPIMLLRDGLLGKVVIADGYHRLCAVYEFDEDAWVPCKII